MNSRDPFTRRWLITLGLWTIGLIIPGTWFGQIPHMSIGRIGAAKILHFAMYAGLAGAAGWLPTNLVGRIAIALPLLSAHGALTEFIQTFVPARTGCVRDWVIDSSGIVAGFALAWHWWPKEPRTK